MGVKVAFDYAAWKARYPEFSAVDETLATALFTEAQLYHRNDGLGPVEDAATQSSLLGLMTAHLAQLFQVANGHAVNELVGRITNASQGSVSLAADANVGDGPSNWLSQSKYGFAYWYATAPYRTFRYLPGPRRYFGPVYGGRLL